MLMKNRLIITLTLLLLVPFMAFSQKKVSSLDFGPYLGRSNYMGEFTDGYMPLWNKTKFAGGLICRYNYGPYLTFKGTAIYGKIEGSDKNFASDAYRGRRNLSFKLQTEICNTKKNRSSVSLGV